MILHEATPDKLTPGLKGPQKRPCAQGMGDFPSYASECHLAVCVAEHGINSLEEMDINQRGARSSKAREKERGSVESKDLFASDERETQSWLRPLIYSRLGNKSLGCLQDKDLLDGLQSSFYLRHQSSC